MTNEYDLPENEELDLLSEEELEALTNPGLTEEQQAILDAGEYTDADGNTFAVYSEEDLPTEEELSAASGDDVQGDGTNCSICGKPLTDPQSIARGIGPECWGKFQTHGWTAEKYTERRIELKLTDDAAAVDETQWVKLARVSEWCRENDIPVARLVRATGGDRAMLPAMDPMFQVRFVGRNRYLPIEAMSNEAKAFLNAMVREAKLKAEKPAKPAKPAKEPKAKAAKVEGETKAAKRKRGKKAADALAGADALYEDPTNEDQGDQG